MNVYIILKLDKNKEIKLSIEEALELYNQLGIMFKKDNIPYLIKYPDNYPKVTF